MTFTGRTKLDRMADTLGDLIARVDGKRDLADFSKYRHDLLGFIRDHYPHITLWHRQEEIVRAIQSSNRVCAYGANATGKDFVSGLIEAWWVVTRPKGRVVKTSARETQVTEVGFRSNLVPRIKELGIKAECFTSAIRMGGETVALGLVSNQVSRLTGYHSEGGVLLVLSEAQGLDDMSFEAAYSVATSDLDAILCLGNPTSPVGPFYQAARSPHWEVIKLSALEHPNVTLGLKPGDAGFIPGGPGLGWVEEMKTAFTPPQYKARVEGEFPAEAQYGLVKREWLEEAARKHASGELRAPPTEETVAGVDIARYGADFSCIAIRRGMHLEEIIKWHGVDTVETVRRVMDEGLRYNIQPEINLGSKGVLKARGLLIVDEAGLGAGPADTLRRTEGYHVLGFNSAHRARGKNSPYHNKRAEAYFNLRDLLMEGRVAIAEDAELWQELIATEYRENDQGRLQLERKDDLSSRLGRSPDKSDSVVMCFSDNAQSRQARVFNVNAWLQGRGSSLA